MLTRSTQKLNTLQNSKHVVVFDCFPYWFRGKMILVLVVYWMWVWQCVLKSVLFYFCNKRNTVYSEGPNFLRSNFGGLTLNIEFTFHLLCMYEIVSCVRWWKVIQEYARWDYSQRRPTHI